MKRYRAAVVGCGKGGDGVGGHSIGHAHGKDWAASPRAELVAACDLNAENLSKFVETFVVAHGGTDLDTLLAEAKPDIVSICTYAGARLPILEACARAGVKGIWCEKPMALTMDDARSMERICRDHDIKLIVNYCRRPLAKFQKVKELIAAGAIGETVIFLASLDGWDQMEWGAHWHDIFQLWANDQPVEWMMGQARCDGSRSGYGHLIEEHSLSYYSFRDGTRALLEGGKVHRGKQAHRIIGTTGMIEIGWDEQIVLTNGDGRHAVPCEGSIHPQGYGDDLSLRVPNSLLDWMEGGSEPELGLPNALRSTEVYLACYESAKIGDRVDFPLGPQQSFPLDGVAARQRKS